MNNQMKNITFIDTNSFMQVSGYANSTNVMTYCNNIADTDYIVFLSLLQSTNNIYSQDMINGGSCVHMADVGKKTEVTITHDRPLGDNTIRQIEQYQSRRLLQSKVIMGYLLQYAESVCCVD